MPQSLAVTHATRLIASRRTLWIAFAIVHAYLVWTNLGPASAGFGDVRSVYPSWVQEGLSGSWPGIDEAWVYPPLAWLPILASSLFGVEALPGMWLVVVGLLDAFVVARLASEPRGMRLAWVWLGLLALLGPIAISRIDSVTVPLAILAMLALRGGRVGLGAGLATAAAWMKVWPGVLWLAMLAVRRERGRVLLAGMGVSVAVVGAMLLLGSGANVLSFLTEQGTRGLQIEAVAATPFLWMAAAGGAAIAYDQQIMTYQVTADGTAAVAAAMTPVLVVVVLVVTVLGAVVVRRGADRSEALAWLVTALVAALVVCNKVGSPQFVGWLIVPALMLAARGAARHWVAVALIGLLAIMTQLIYPWLYPEITAATLEGLLLVTTRNAAEVVLLVLALWWLVSLAVQAPTRAPSLSSTR